MLLLVAVFFIKPASSAGRILIYKISSQILADNWLGGIGINQFKTTYPYYQASYFASGKHTSAELLLADNTYYAFNDYFQFIIETGIVGVFILFAAFAAIGWLIRKAYTGGYTKRFVLNLACCQLVAICVAACFTYVFSKPAFQVLFVGCVGVIAFYAFYQSRPANYAVPVIAVLIAAICLSAPYSFNLNNYRSEKEVVNIKTLHRAGLKSDVKKKLLSLPPFLQDNEGYLEIKYEHLMQEGNIQAAETTLKKLIKTVASNNNYLRLANLYFIKGETKKAEKAYLLAVHMVPNRFRSRYALYNFYKATGQACKSVECAKEILALPVKIPSYEVERVKRIAANDLNLAH